MNTFSDKNPQNHIDGELIAILPVVEQVRALHAKGRYGFDICPENIVMTRRGALLRVKNIALSASGASVYRPGYTPRERYMGAEPGTWTDVYAVSALVYTAMTGLMLPSAFERGHTEPLFGGLDKKYRALEEVVAQGLAPDAGQRLKSLDALSEQIQACLNGYRPPAKIRAGKERKPIKHKKATAAVSIAALLLLSGAVLVNEVNYAQAVSRTETGEYTLAQDSLKGVFAFYKDASQLFRFTVAGLSLQSGAFDAAAQGFLALGGYRDADEMVRETDYRHAQVLLRQGCLAEAENLLKSTGDYKDALLLLKRISYEKGDIYFDAGLYFSAIGAFRNASDYADAAARVDEAMDKLYVAGISALGEGEIDLAKQYFAVLTGYKQADELAKLAVVLLHVQHGEAVTQDEYVFITGFADRVDLSSYLTSDSLSMYYLRGSWRDEAGNIFSLDGSGGITCNIPGFAGNSYVFNGGVLYIGVKAVLRFTGVDLNTVEIVSYADGVTYVMKRI